MTGRRTAIFASLAIAAASLTACNAHSKSDSSDDKPAVLSATDDAALVPVVACKTTRGAPAPHGEPYPANLTLPPDSAAIAPQVAFYTDAARLLTPILGPRGWKCAATSGADGASSITVFPDGSTDKGSTKVSAQVEPACQGCVYDLVCNYIPIAAQQLNHGVADCTSDPSDPQHVSFLGSYWVKGSPDASGPTDDIVEISPGPPAFARSALLYRWSPRRGAAAALESCHLPLAEATLCPPITSDFEARNEDAY